MTRTRIAAILSALLLLSLTPGALTASELDTPVSQTDNMEFVGNVEYEFTDADGMWRSAGNVTDSDFMDFTVPEGWTVPDMGENGGVEIPADYDPQAGDVLQLNLMGTYNTGMFVTDITDPHNPVVVSRWDCGVSQADVFVFERDDLGRTFAAYSQDAGSAGNRNTDCFTDAAELRGAPLPANARGTFLVDVTDPFRPATENFLQMRKGTHQTTVHPSGKYVYNSAAVVVTTYPGTIEVYDITDPRAPEMVSEILLGPGLDVHDMTFWKGGDRLYAAALTHSFVINTEDPADPQIVGRIYDPSVNIHHDAHLVTVDGPAGEREFMLVGDEQGGAGASVYCPGGGVHVYDVTGPLENAPVKIGAWFIEDTGVSGTCTAHVMQVLPEEELIVMAWYSGGVRVLDYSGLGTLPAVSKFGVGTDAIAEVAHSRFSNSNLWSAKVREVREDDGGFYIFGGDMGRHLDIWSFTPEGGEASETRGTWMNPQQAMRKALAERAGISTLDSGVMTPNCLLPAGI